MKKIIVTAFMTILLLVCLFPAQAIAKDINAAQLYIAGVNVTSGGYWTIDNTGATSILKYQSEAPADKYIHFNASEQILTLKNAEIKTGDGDGFQNSAIYFGDPSAENGITDMSFRINLSGNNYVTYITNNGSGWNNAVFSGGNLIITGAADSSTPSLEVNASGGTDGNCGISAQNGLTIENGYIGSLAGVGGIIVKNGNYGIIVNGNCNIMDGFVSAIATGAVGTPGSTDIVGLCCLKKQGFSMSNGYLRAASETDNITASGSEKLCGLVSDSIGTIIDPELVSVGISSRSEFLEPWEPQKSSLYKVVEINYSVKWVSLSTDEPISGERVIATTYPRSANVTYTWSEIDSSGNETVNDTQKTATYTAEIGIGNKLKVTVTGVKPYVGTVSATTRYPATLKAQFDPPSNSKFPLQNAPEKLSLILGKGTKINKNDFENLTVDSKVVPASVNTFIVTDGSVIVNFQKQYLDSLSVGTHTVELTIGGTKYAGKYSAEFTVTEPVPDTSSSDIPHDNPPDNPNTGDLSKSTLFTALGLLCVSGIISFSVIKRKKIWK